MSGETLDVASLLTIDVESELRKLTQAAQNQGAGSSVGRRTYQKGLETLQWRADGGGFTVARRVVVPTGRVAPDDIQRFLAAPGLTLAQADAWLDQHSRQQTGGLDAVLAAHHVVEDDDLVAVLVVELGRHDCVLEGLDAA